MKNEFKKMYGKIPLWSAWGLKFTLSPEVKKGVATQYTAILFLQPGGLSSVLVISCSKIAD
jgi:hypothetical protein